MKKIARVLIVLSIILTFTSLAYGQNEIRIGVIFPLTGPAASTGQVLLEGVKLAADIVNKKTDLNMPLAKTEGLPALKGAKIKIIVGDHQSKPEVGMAEAERLITQEKVVALVGCYNSGVTATASQAAERYGIPFVNETSTSPTLTERGFKWFFRTTPNDDLLSENFFMFLTDLKKKKIIGAVPVAIFNENTLFGTDSAKFQQKYAAKYGFPVAGTVMYPAKSTQLTSEIQKLKSYNPRIILQTSYIADAILSMKTYRELNFTPDAILANDAGFIDPEFVKSLGKDANYILSREVWAKDLSSKKPIIKKVADMFEKRTGKPMDGSSARSFTAMIVLADAINRAGSTAPDKIQGSLLKTNIKADQLIMPWDGVRFDPKTHQNVLGKGIIVQLINGQYRTVWPFNLATQKVVWPFPKWNAKR
ncbi:MAG: ABC transporter substrate-binding protein [Syntrophales bacterium]|nr:ABC transporter substrate-binding protein [Syntrophales bacterium]